MKLPFHRAPERNLRQPAPSIIPTLQTANVSARYHAARKGGDFHDFVASGSGRMLFVLLDIAGERAEALNIAAAAQDRFRTEGPPMFEKPYVNVADALTDLSILLNRTIMQAAEGVRHAPAFLGCYDEDLGTVCYINAGHTPALVMDKDGILQLQANGLPLGLFSHATHDAQICVLQPGAALVVVSRGVVECSSKHAEYGLGRVEERLRQNQFKDAEQICDAILGDMQAHARNCKVENDASTLALMRTAGMREEAVATPVLARPGNA